MITKSRSGLVLHFLPESVVSRADARDVEYRPDPMRSAMPFHYVQGSSPATTSRWTRSRAHAGTPVHVYSAATIVDRYRALDDAVHAHPHRLHYAIKANATLGIVRLLRELGASADANSGGEIEVALRAGFAAGRHRLHRRRQDARPSSIAPSASRLGAINAESSGEMERIAARAQAQDTRVRDRRPHQPGRGRRQPSAHLDRPPRHQVRHDRR